MSTRQFNLNNINGLYLSYEPSTPIALSEYNNVLLENGDFFPKTLAESTQLILSNTNFDTTINGVVGTNSAAKFNTPLKYSQITKPGSLVLFGEYFNKFTLYFRFYGSESLWSDPSQESLRVYPTIKLGGNEVKPVLSNYKWYNRYTNTWVSAVTNGTKGLYADDGFF